MSDLEGLYREHRAGLVRLVERELRDRNDAEDVVQTAFLDAQRALRRGTIPHNPRAWLAAIALNAARRLRSRHVSVEALEEYAAQEVFRLPEIRAALAGLPKHEQAAVLYRDVLGLSYAEMAEHMNTTVPAVTMLLHRARNRLRGLLASAVVGAGMWRWLRSNVWEATAAKAAGVVVLTGGLATAGVVTSTRVVRATPPTAAPVATAATQGRGKAADVVRRLGEARVRTDRTERRSARAAATEQSAATTASAATPPAAVAAPTTGQSPSGQVVPAKAPSTAQTDRGTAVTVSVPRLPTPGLTLTTPALPSATATVATPVATVAVTVPPGVTATVPTPIVTLTVKVP